MPTRKLIASSHPPYRHRDYVSTRLRAPEQPLLRVPQFFPDRAGPPIGSTMLAPVDADLTKNGRCNGEPVGERIIVAGRIVDQKGRPLPRALVEIWQANAAGRYTQPTDQHDAPLDPNFLGAGRCESDASGRYSFRTIKPGAYPWQNHPNAWRPNHIHLSLFGSGCGSRLVTQLYFPGDPLLTLDPIFNSVPAGARDLLVAQFDLDRTEPGIALAYRFDIVLRGPRATPREA
ncbi:MAG: protocatechuate 3,4-dioxygenase subunit beta [Alphaproteobacteria bacterium]|nr:protocatechuate 3,4-dioxygenase subunit beta [Alphaproteobacteria bacterium]